MTLSSLRSMRNQTGEHQMGLDPHVTDMEFGRYWQGDRKFVIASVAEPRAMGKLD